MEYHAQSADPSAMAEIGDASTTPSEDSHEPWGWSNFFNETSRFLLSLERQYGIANQAFAEYAVSRLSAVHTRRLPYILHNQ